jgi:hypothetical protein
MSWKDAPSGWSNWRDNNERRGESPSVRRSDRAGGHLAHTLGKSGPTPPKLRRADCDSDLTIRPNSDPVASGFEPFPRGDDGNLTLQSPSAAQGIRQELENPVSDRRADSRSLFRLPAILGRIVTRR